MVSQHLPVADRIAEGEARPAADHQMNAFGLARVVVVEQELWLRHQHRPPIGGVLVMDPAGRADHLLRGGIPEVRSE